MKRNALRRILGFLMAFVMVVGLIPAAAIPVFAQNITGSMNASGSVQPDVISYVNGNRAVTEKAYDQDPETVITVYYDFGKCNDYIIEEINIVDVIAPVAGQHPSYTANVSGTGYHVDTTKNACEDIYWKNPPESGITSKTVSPGGM